MTKRRGRVPSGVALAVLFMLVSPTPRPAAAQSSQPRQPAVPAPVISDTGDLKGPRQPIFFRHDVHAGQDQIPCMYCHATVAVSSEPGIPALETCMGCHRIIGGSTDSHRTEIQKVRNAWRDRKAPEWARVHALPGFARFPHMRHIKALGEGTPGGGANTCTTCHGDVFRMPQVYQVATLKMGWCISCHVERKVSRDCTICHY